MASVVVITECEKIAHRIEDVLAPQDTVVVCGKEGECGDLKPDLLLLAGWDSISEVMAVYHALPAKLSAVPAAFVCLLDQGWNLLPLCAGMTDDNGFKKMLSEFLHRQPCIAQHEGLSDIQSELHNGSWEDDACGVMQVDFGNFGSIYRFAEKQAERTGHDVQTLLLTLIPRQRVQASAKQIQYAMKQLSQAIQMTLRKNDVLTGCSECQMLVLLMDADDDGGHLAANRILNTFLGLYEEMEFELCYDIRSITAHK